MKKRKDAILNMHQILLKRREALRKALDGDLSLLQELREKAGDVVDVASESAQGEICSQLAQVESRELGQIEKALDRMREGTYGICEECSNSIPVARLNALPYATKCVKCQRETEIEEHGGSDDVNWGNLIDTPSSSSDVSVGDYEVDMQ